MQKITTTPGSDNIDTFDAIDSTGALYPLDAVTRIDVAIISERAALSGGVLRISTTDTPPAVSFSGSTISVRFGALSPYRGTYYPQIIVYDANNPDGVVIAGEGYPAEILLKVDA